MGLQLSREVGPKSKLRDPGVGRAGTHPGEGGGRGGGGEFPPLRRGTPRGEEDPAAKTGTGWLEWNEDSQPCEERRLRTRASGSLVPDDFRAVALEWEG